MFADLKSQRRVVLKRHHRLELTKAAKEKITRPHPPPYPQAGRSSSSGHLESSGGASGAAKRTGCKTDRERRGLVIHWEHFDVEVLIEF